MNTTSTTSRIVTYSLILFAVMRGCLPSFTHAAINPSNIAPTATVTATTPEMGSIAGLINGIIQPSGTEYRSNTASAAFINFQFSSDRTIGHIRVYTEISVKNWFNNATITLYNSAGGVLYSHYLGTDGNAEVVNLDLESLNKVYTNVRSVRITGDGVARLSLREIQIFQSANFSVPANQTWLGARAWYKSDTGIASDMDGRVRKWFDVTANKINMTTNNNNQGAEYVANSLNGRPGVKFSETSQHTLKSENMLLFQGSSVTNAHVYYVTTLEQGGSSVDNSMIFTSDGNTDRYRVIGPSRSGGDPVYNQFLTEISPQTNNRSLYRNWAGNTSQFQYNVPHVMASIFSTTAGVGTQLKTNGIIRASNYSSTAMNIGSVQGGGGSTLGGFPGLNTIKGTINEVMAFSTSLTVNQIAQVESYLAVKYGITMLTDYRASNDTVVWSNASNSAYANRIFGIARDDTSTLSITSSQSTVGSSPMFTLNAGSSMANLQYLIAGDNNAALTWTTSGAPNGLSILNRKWYIQKAGTASYNVDISIPSNLIPATGSSVFLVMNTSSDLSASSTILLMTLAGGRYTASNVPVTANSYFSIGAGVPTALIGNFVWIDTNKNGIQDGGEAGVNAVTVRLRSCGPYAVGTQPQINYDGTIIATTTTNSAGNYSFTAVPGDYYLEFVLPSAYKFTIQHVGGYGTNNTTNSDASPLSSKTRCESFGYGSVDNSIDAGAITQTYSSCDSLTLSNTVTVGANQYQKPNVGFTANLVGFGQVGVVAGVNVSGVGTAPGGTTWRSISWSPTLTSSVLGAETITATVDSINYKLEYYNNPAALTIGTCPYKSSGGVYCAEKTPLAPYLTPSINMNSSPTTIEPIDYCAGAQTAWSCTANLDRPQSSLVKTLNTCSQTVIIYDEASICNNLVTDMSAADCNGLLNLYSSTNGASWNTNTRWMFNGDATWNTACDWHGVTCAGGRVTQVNLPSNNMVGTLPTLPAGAWTALTNINVSSNNLSSTLPSAWSTLTAMRYFNVGSNANLNTTLPVGWSTWTQMLGFWANGTRPAGSIPTQWSTWKRLQTFIVDSPVVGGYVGTLPSSWSTMTNMRNFQINSNNLDGVIPTQWSSMTQMRAFIAHNNNLDGVIPTTIQSWTLLDINGWNSVLSNNCMGRVAGGLLTWLDSRFRGDNTTSWNNAALYGWRVQKKCSTDLRITSVTTTDDLVNDNSAVYSVTINNNGSRRAYSPVVTVTLQGGLTTTTPTIIFGALAPGASQTLTLTVTKGASVTVGTFARTNTFVLSDTTITETSTPNNTTTHVISVKGSSYGVCNNSALTVPVVECEALGDLYNSTAGASWTNKTNWMISPDVNSWFGVTTTTVSSQQYVYYLCMHRDNAGNSWCSGSSSNNNGNNLIGTIPASIGNLSYLKFLIMSFNSISGSLPTTIDQLDRVTHMYLNHNLLNGSLPSTIGGMALLQYMYMYNNSISGTIPSGIASLPSIIYIHLGTNNLSGPIPDMSALNNTLQNLVLSTNNLSGPIPSWIYNMTNLRTLYLGGNPITGTLSSSINNLTNLTHLMLDSAQMSGPMPAITIPTLQYLHTHSNAFTTLPASLPASLREYLGYTNSMAGSLPTGWSNLTNLTYIHLGGNLITGTLPASWSSMNSLLYLYMWSNQIEGTIPASWLSSGMTSLQALGLGNNNLEGDIPATALQAKTSLNVTNINNMIGTNCFNKLGLTTAQESYLDTYFKYNGGPTGFYHWRTQKSCTTDLEVVSATTPGNLSSDREMTYTVTVRNNGPRTAYDPKLTITLTNGLQFSDTGLSTKTISVGELTSSQTVVYTMTVNKAGLSTSSVSYTNSFVIADTTITDSSSANNTKTHAGTASGSPYSVCLNLSTTVPQAECEALADLYTSTAGGSWTNKTNWLISTDVNSWFGVTVAGGTVTRICLNRDGSGNAFCSESQGASLTNANNLVGTIPSSIGNLTNLQQLFIGRNVGITGSLPSTIDNLDQLTHLYINYTSINSLPTTIGGMAKLKHLIAYNANITSIPSQIANLPLINQLQFQFNSITSLPDMSALNNTLRIFYFHNNQLAGSIPLWMGNLTNLTHFYIGYNPFTAGPAPSWICNMTNLYYLYIEGNNLNGELPSCFNNRFPQMRTFQLQGNQLEGNLPDLSSSTYLTHYYLHSNNFSGPLPAWLPSISTFRYLYLDNNKLSGPIPDSYTGMSTDNIIFRVNSNNLDRDTAGNAIISPALQNWWNSIVVYQNNPGVYKTINAQGDITHPLLGANARRISAIPGGNYPSKPMSTLLLAGPNTTTVPVVLLGGSPSHVLYDVGNHNLGLQNGKTYTFSFRARTVAGTRNIDPSFTDDGNIGGIAQTRAIDTSWKLISVTHTYTSIGASPRVFVSRALGGGDFYYYDPVVTESAPIPSDIRFTTIPYASMVIDGSDFATAGSAITAGGGGVCSNITITPNLQNDKGLVAYYNFDENDTTDKAGGDNNGTAVSTTFEVGKINTALYSTAAGYITHSTQGLNSTNGTISTWIKPSQTYGGIWQTHDAVGQNRSDWIALFAYPNGNLYFRMYNGGVNYDVTVPTATYYPINQWTHIAATWEGDADGVADDVMRLYINGVQVTTRSNANFQSVIDPYARVGMGHTYGLYGGLDDFRAYDRALSATEIASLTQSALNFAAGGSYNGCFVTTTDRANNTSNAVRLGNFTVTFSPYPVCNNPALTISQDECTALGDIYTSAGGVSWTTKTNWLTATDVNSWFGVTVAGGRVTVLSLPSNNLSGSLNTSIGNLTGLTSIILNNNNLASTLPTTIGNLSALVTLNLSFNKFTGTIPTAWGSSMTALKVLDLDNNLLNGAIPTQIASMPVLETLDLSVNSLTRPTATLKNTANTLKILRLNNNSLAGAIPTWVYTLTNLTDLNLASNTSVGGTLTSSINLLTKLVNAYLNNMGLTSSIPNITIPTLQILILNGNSLNGTLPSLPSSIRYFRAYDNTITGQLPISYGSLSNLQYLMLWSNSLDGIIPTQWSSLTSLLRLGLGNNNLEGVLPVAILQSMTSLQNNQRGSMIGSNCFYTGSLNGTQTSYLDTKFHYRTSGTWAWRTQKSCTTDLEVVSATTPGNLSSDREMTYAVTVRNNGPRTAYDPKLTITLTNGLQFSGTTQSTQTINIGQLTNGQTSTITIVVNKLGVGSSTINYTNSFVIADTTITDSSSANNTKTHAGTASGSPYSVCLKLSTTVPQAECEALGDLYVSTAGASRTRKDNWLSSPDVNSWFGVTVVSGRVTRICLNRDSAGNARCSSSNGGLGANNLVGSIPASIGDLPNLEYLILGYNAGLTGPIPSTIDQLDNLTHLYLHNTTVNGSLPSTIGGLAKLTYLFLNNNNISGSIPTTIKDLPLINTIQLAYTQLSGPIPDMSNLNNTLRTLYLYNIPSLNGGIPTWVSNMTNLNIFHIGSSSVGGTIPTEVCGMTNLTQLQIYGNSLTGPIPSCIWNMNKITHLSLNSNSLEGSIPETISNMSALQHLYLGENPLMRGPIPQALGNISTLRGLYLRNMGLTGPIPDNMTNLTLLSRLQIESNYLDRDTSSVALMTPAQTSWYNALTPAAGGYIVNNAQGDITHPLLGANARRIQATPSFNYPGKPISTPLLAGPNTTSISATLLGGSPSHVVYDVGYHNLGLQNGKTYTFSFRARTVAGTRSINPGLSDNINDGVSAEIRSIDTNWKLVSVTKTYTSIGASPRILPNFSLAGGDFYYYDPVVTESAPIPSDIRFTTIPYASMMIDGSDLATAGSAITAGGGGTCSNISVTPASHNDKGLVAYYTFDDSDATDKSTNGLNGTLVNGPTFVDGRIGKAANLIGTQRITTSVTGVQIQTLSFRVNLTNPISSSTTRKQFASPAGGISGIGFGSTTSAFAGETLTFFGLDGGSHKTAIFDSIPGGWNMVTLSWNGSTYDVYLNGQQKTTYHQGNGASLMTSMYMLGGSEMYAYHFNDKIDDIRIYNRALTATEVSSMYDKRINFAQPGNYNGCYLTASDRATNTSNAVRLGNFTVTFSPYPICNNPALTVPQEECTALMDFYTATNGASWTARSNRGVSPNVDTWDTWVSGAYANVKVSDGHVTELDVYANNLAGTTDMAMVCDLPYLDKLRVRTNVNLNLSIPTCIGALSQLTSFNLYFNRLAGTIPTGLYTLTGLTYLNLMDHNSNTAGGFTAGLTTSLGNLTNLTYLTISSHPLNVALPSTISSLTKLETLVMDANGLTGPLTPIASLTKLKALSMNSNNFNNPLPSNIGNLTGLVLLNLVNSKINGTLPSSLGSLTALRGLDLSNNLLTGPVPSSLSTLTALYQGTGSLPAGYTSYSSTTFGNGWDHSVYAGLTIANNYLDRDLSNNAIIPSALTIWYNNVVLKAISNQIDNIAPVIASSTLAGTYSFDTINHTITLTESSMLAASGMSITVGGGGTCSQLTVSGSLMTGTGANIVQLKFAPGSSATTVYSNCTLRTTDHAGNLSNTINLGNWSVALQPYPICNNASLTIPQNECTALMDFYTNLGGASWVNKTGWGSDANVNNWFAVTVSAGRVQKLEFPNSNNLVGTMPNIFNNLTGMRSFSVASNNGIIGQMPTTLSSLPVLTQITINNSNMTGSMLASLPSTMTLVSINSNPALTAGPLPSAWSTATNLTYLSVQNNNLNGALPASWSSLTKLTYMHLGYNNFNSQIPTSWLTALTGVGQMVWSDANFDGPLPVELLNWNTNTAYASNFLNNNCFGTGHLTASEINSFDTKWTRAKWAPQKKCTTDLVLTVVPSGNLTTSNAMLYTITVTNNGTRWAYSPQVAVTLLGGLQSQNSSNPVIMFDTLAPGATQTQTITVIKSATSPTTQSNITSTFVLSDVTITDSTSANNTVTNVQAVKASTKSYCNHYGLSIPVIECEALGDLYASTAGASWTTKTNWTTSPNVDSWFGITSSQDSDLVAHYTFDANNATDDAGNGRDGISVGSPSFTAGRIGNAVNFDGTSKRITVANNFVHGTSDFTYSWWTKWNNTPTTYQTYIDNGTWGNTLLFRQENATQIGIYSMGPLRGTLAFTPKPGQRQHMIFTRVGNTMFFYVDGVLQGSFAFNVNIQSTANMFIGTSQHSTTQNLNAMMDDVRIYSRALSAVEITSLYQSTTTVDNVLKLCMSNPVESTVCNYAYQGVIGNNLVGTLPSTIGNLGEMTYLVINKNSITGTLPSAWSTLTKLFYLGLEQNNISGTIPTTWGGMTNLTQLGTSSNPNLGGAIPSQLTSTKLNIWWGSNNSFTSLPDLSVLNWGQLQLGNNDLSGPLPAWLGMEGGLSYIDLSLNEFTGPIPTTRGSLQNPWVLYLHNNNLTGNLDVMSSVNLNGLTHFQIQNNNFDRDPSNSAILPTNFATRLPQMTVSNITNQGDTTPPVLSTTTVIPSTIDGSFDYIINLNEGSSTTGAGYASGLSVIFTGSTKCTTKLAINPDKLLNKGNTTVTIAALEGGQYVGCGLYTVDRAGLQSNVLSLTTFTASDYGICNLVSDIPQGDCRVLVDLYNSTNGSGWTTSTNWKGIGDSTPTTACDWYGVKCSSGRVWRLFLGGKENPTDQACDWGDHPGNNLVGTLPASIGNLTWLTVLCAPNNQITGPLPSNIGDPTRLLAVSLWGNPLNTSLPPQWGNQTTLAYLIMRNTGITGNLPASWSGMTSMFYFSAHDNNLNGELPASWSTMTNMRLLYLYSNSFTGPLPASWGSMANMDLLYLHNNALTGPLPSERSRMTKVRVLYAHINALTGPLPSSWGSMTGLAILYLQNNNISGLIPDSWTNNPSWSTTTKSNLSNNCLSTSTSYMTAGLSNMLTSKFNTSPQKNCPGSIGSRVWTDTNENGILDNGEVGPSGVTATLRACTDQTPVNSADKVLDHELSANYSFDANNSIDNSNIGSNSMVASNVTYADGKINRAASFAGNGYLLRNNYNNFPSTQITTAFWAKTSDSNDGIISYASSNINNNDWLLFGSNSLIVHVAGLGRGTNVSFSDNQWHHIVVTWDSTDGALKVYKNNILAYNGIFAQGSSITPGGSLAIGGEQDSLGGGWDNAQAYNGLMDDVRIYNRILSASEVSQLYTITTPQTASNMPISYNGASVTSTTTTTNGTYNFANVVAGKYYVEYSNIPAGYKFTTQNIGAGINPGNSDVNPWSAKTSCFELYNGLSEANIDAGLTYLPYSSCESTSAAYTPTLAGQPVTLSIGGYGTNGQIQALNGASVVLNQSITNQGTNRGVKTWTYNWTPTVAGTYTLSGAVDGYNYRLDHYSNPSLGTVSCAYRTIGAGSWCAVQSTVTPYTTTLTNVNQIATIPSPISYCTAGQISSLPCSTAGDQPSSMVVQVPNTCTSTLVVTSDLNVMCDNVTDMQPAECKALITLYDSTAGASWTNKSNWKFAGDTTPRTACDWYGVSCAGGRVTALSMIGNNLNGTLPTLAGLSLLSHLNLSSNNISGILPITWQTNLSSLSYLNLQYNQITGGLPTQRSTWSSIRDIEISMNLLTGILPPQWSSLINLVNFTARGNDFTGQLPSSWSSMIKLRIFAISNSSINGNLPDSWSNITGLQTFMAVSSQLTGTVPQSWFGTMKSLTRFQVWDNNMDGPIPVTGFQQMTNLNASSILSSVGTNCMGVSHLSLADQIYLNSRFSGMPSRNRAGSNWSDQKICQTDLQLSLVSKVGSLYDANSLTYTLRYVNAGSRWSYDTKLGLTTDTRIGIASGSTTGVIKTGINLGILAPGATSTITFVLDKTGFSGGLVSINNQFALVDTTISELVSTNNVYNDNGVQVLGSSFPICRDPALTIPQLECETLMSMYGSLNGPSWTTKTGWGTDPDVDNWYGVGVNAGRVNRLNFGYLDNNLIGQIPGIISNLKALTEFGITYQAGVNGVIPFEIGDITTLTRIEIYKNGLSGPIPSSIGNLTGLTNLYLGGGYTFGVNTGFTSYPSTIANLTKLRTLVIMDSYMSGTLPALTGFTQLENISFRNQRFTGTIPDNWKNLPLKTINLSNNNLIGELPEGYSLLNNSLNVLNLNNNELDGPIPEWFTSLTNLQ